MQLRANAGSPLSKKIVICGHALGRSIPVDGKFEKDEAGKEIPQLILESGEVLSHSSAMLNHVGTELAKSTGTDAAAVVALLEYTLNEVDPMLAAHDKEHKGKGLAAGLPAVCEKIASLASPFLCGASMSAADVSLAVSLHRQITGPCSEEFAAAYPAVLAWFNRCCGSDCFVKVFPPRKAPAAKTAAPAAPVKEVAVARGPRPEVINVAPTSIRIPQVAKSFSGRMRLSALLESSSAAPIGKMIAVAGWTRTIRAANAGQLLFVELNDGSCVQNLQVVVSKEMGEAFTKLSAGSVSCSARFEGLLVECKGANRKQDFELQICDPARGDKLEVFDVPNVEKYILAGKDVSVETLRKHANMRPRTAFISAIMRVRSQMAMATHRFFQERGFNYIHTPIVTASDCEGAGEMFQVTTILPEHNEPMAKDMMTANGKIDYEKDFFARKAFLTVSGQLALENYACAMSDVYTFGPTFRAEMSHTARHLAEFWMIEPEMAFATLEDVMQTAEGYLKFCVQWALDNCAADIEFLATRATEPNLIPRLEQIAQTPFHRVTYDDAIDLLKPHASKFEESNIEFGIDLATEHERFLTEQIFKGPTFVYNYPKSFKAFYMRRNDDGRTVQATDLLLPQIGEVIGGSAREERIDELDKALEEKGLSKEDYWWYRDLRTLGSVPHGGFGLGFERLIMLVTGVSNIRDVIPFPRYPGHAEF